jgi:two-component sensor histidine kinase
VSFRAPAKLWLLILIGCLVAAALDVLQTRLKGNAAWGALVFQGGEWILLGALTPITYYLGRRWPLQGPHVSRSLLVHVVGALVLCIGWATFGVILRRAVNAWGDTDPPFGADWLSWTLTSLPWSFFMYFAVLGCVHAFAYYVEARDREAQAARLHGQLAEARLEALRMQLQPHFLFNSLNAILVLVRDQETRSAARMLEQLSEMLRQVLRTDRPHEVPLEEELSLIRQYLAIEQVRFSDRLRIRYDVPEALQSAAVPRFILQPLVENALRHGVAERTEAVWIEIGAARAGTDLELWVRDGGRGPVEGRRAGVGLENTKARLATLYGARAGLELSAEPAGGTRARIRLPYRDYDGQEAEHTNA